MKVGTDGVLLGAWADVSRARTILDIGTGTGIIALMLAQRSGGGARIDAIDIDQSAVDEARDNFGSSPWPEAFRASCVSLQEFSGKPENAALYDLIVSNPPFFVDSLKAPDQRRTTARHTDTLPPVDLIAASLKMLKPDGTLAVIYPAEEAMQFVAAAESSALFLTRMCKVSTAAGKAPKRILMELSRNATAPIFEELSLDSEEYRKLTSEFYL